MRGMRVVNERARQVQIGQQGAHHHVRERAGERQERQRVEESGGVARELVPAPAEAVSAPVSAIVVVPASPEATVATVVAAGRAAGLLAAATAPARRVSRRRAGEGPKARPNHRNPPSPSLDRELVRLCARGGRRGGSGSSCRGDDRQGLHPAAGPPLRRRARRARCGRARRRGAPALRAFEARRLGVSRGPGTRSCRF